MEKTHWIFLLTILILAAILGLGILMYTHTQEQAFKVTSREFTRKQNLTDAKLKEQIGQMIMVGFLGKEASEHSDIAQVIKDVAIGGVVLFDYSIPSHTFPRNIVNYTQTKKLISDIQQYSPIPLFVAVDAEGGNVNRLKETYGFLPIVSAEKMGQDTTLQTTHKASTELARELKSLGFNMNFAPIVDVNTNTKNPIIGALGRSFSSEPKDVADHAKIFIQNHAKKNIITVAKHFPGHGSSITDSHRELPDVTDTYTTEELFPYQKLNKEGLLKAVMTAHIINKHIDATYPATLSTVFLQDILRNQIGFKGVIISDDMQMAAMSNNYTIDEAIILAVNAGCDILSFANNGPNGYDNKIAYKVRDIIFNAVKANKIKEERITESYNRIRNLKKEFNIVQSAKKESHIAEIKSKNFELLGEPNTLTFGEALDIAQWVEKLTHTRSAFLLSIFQEELTLEKFDMCYLTNFTTGEGMRIHDGATVAKVMKPGKDIQYFLLLTKELGRNPSQTPITCPMSFGWGGAMGPADFIPSTWMQYKQKIEKITGISADPWNIRDAFLAAGLYLSDSGAKTKTRNGEWNAAMIYFSGSADSPYTWYATDAMAIAQELQEDIDIIKKNN